MEYRQWLSQVCRYAEELLDCTATIEWGGAVVLTFKPFGTMVWFMTFEEDWLKREYGPDIHPKSAAYGMAVLIKDEWCKVLFNRGEPND